MYEKTILLVNTANFRAVVHQLCQRFVNTSIKEHRGLPIDSYRKLRYRALLNDAIPIIRYFASGLPAPDHKAQLINRRFKRVLSANTTRKIKITE